MCILLKNSVGDYLLLHVHAYYDCMLRYCEGVLPKKFGNLGALS